MPCLAARRFAPVVVMLTAPPCRVFRINAIFASPRDRRVIRDAQCASASFSQQCHLLVTRRRTRCCDAQCASALVCA